MLFFHGTRVSPLLVHVFYSSLSLFQFRFCLIFEGWLISSCCCVLVFSLYLLSLKPMCPCLNLGVHAACSFILTTFVSYGWCSIFIPDLFPCVSTSLITLQGIYGLFFLCPLTERLFSCTYVCKFLIVQVSRMT